MKIAILGAGAIGCYYGARLEAAGHEVCYIMRSACDAVRKDGLSIRSVAGDVRLPHVCVARTPQECGEADLVIVAWKTCSNGLLARALPQLTGKHTRVLTLQNGMGNAELIGAVVPPQTVFMGLCFVCCMTEAPGCINHLEGGDIQFAPLQPTDEGADGARQLAALFAGAGIRTETFRFTEDILWRKLTWNIPFNGLCLALGGIDVRKLFSMPEQVQRARGIIDEVCLTSRLRGFPTPEGIADYQMERTAKMGPFIPSSAVDYNKGRAVEYDAIWGTPLERAHAVHAHVPLWEQLCRDICLRIHRQSA